MINNPESTMVIAADDADTTVKHILGLAKFHRWIRTFTDAWIEHDMPSIINFSADMSAYFAIAFPSAEYEPIQLGCQSAESDWLNLIAIGGVSIDSVRGRIYLMVKGYTLLGQSIPPIAIGIHLNTKWKAVQFERHSVIDFYNVQVADGNVVEVGEKAFKTNVAILFSTPESIMSSLVSQTKTANQTMHESIQSLL